MGDELAGDDGGGVRVFLESVEEVRNGGFTEDEVVGVDCDKGFVIADIRAGGGDRGAVAVRIRGVLDDNGDFGEVENLGD